MNEKPEWLEAMSVLSVQPGDVIVIKTPPFVELTIEQRVRVEEYFTSKVKAPVLVLDRGVDIGVLREPA